MPKDDNEENSLLLSLKELKKMAPDAAPGPGEPAQEPGRKPLPADGRASAAGSSAAPSSGPSTTSVRLTLVEDERRRIEAERNRIEEERRERLRREEDRRLAEERRLADVERERLLREEAAKRKEAAARAAAAAREAAQAALAAEPPRPTGIVLKPVTAAVAGGITLTAVVALAIVAFTRPPARPSLVVPASATTRVDAVATTEGEPMPDVGPELIWFAVGDVAKPADAEEEDRPRRKAKRRRRKRPSGSAAPEGSDPPKRVFVPAPRKDGFEY